jgi:2-polyprenyl-3-methyl-5-hydroxy-6-metoxy-1,4-benzoquinol methylase
VISDEYRALNEQLHRDRPTYGANGYKHAPLVRQLMIDYRTSDVLDYGCGKASLSKEIPCANYDPCIPKYADDPDPADIVACFDVLEHIEPEFLHSVLTHLRQLTRKALVCVIATHPDRSKNLPDGSNPHRIVEDAGWWVEKMAEYFTVLDHHVGPKEVTLWVIP